MELNTVQIIVLLIFIITYFLIFTERLHRTIAALAGAVVLMIYGKVSGFLTSEDIIEMIEYEVIFLLTCMMIIVSVLMRTGFFEFIAIKAAKYARGDPWKIMIYLGFFAGFISMVIDNVTTVLLLVPVTISIAKTLGLSPVPILLAEAILSNVGGVGTLIGDPPNIMIAAATGYTFMDFLIYLLPPVLICILITALYFKFYYRDYLKTKPKNIQKIMQMDEYKVIKDPILMKRTLIILAVTIAIFTIHHKIGLEPFEVAAIGAALTLLINFRRVQHDLHKVFEGVEWPTLVFFAGLFIIVGTVEKVGILEMLAGFLVGFVYENYILSNLLVLWGSALGSAIVDNIPFTATMIPLIKHIEEAGVNVEPMWWALAIGAGFGGNGTPIGSSAGVITIGLSEKLGYRITFKEWLLVGTPTMILCCLVGSLFVVFVYI